MRKRRSKQWHKLHLLPSGLDMTTQGVTYTRDILVADRIMYPTGCFQLQWAAPHPVTPGWLVAMYKKVIV